MPVFMPHVDFGWALVATAPSPASSGTSLGVTAGLGTNFPDPALVGTYIATVCPGASLPTWANAEEVLVTAKVTDTFTITRAQGTTSARTIVAGDQFFIGIVAKVIKDIEGALDNSTNDFRLTLTSGTPVTTPDVTGATTLYCTPVGKGNRIALYNSTFSAWLWDSSAEFSIPLGTLVNAQGYDVFCFDNAGVPTLELNEWANATITVTIASPGVVTWTGHGMATGNSITFTTTGALPTGITANTQYFITVVDANTFKLSTSLANVAAGTFVNTSVSQSGTHTGHQPQARQTALVKQDGVLVKSGAASRRYLAAFMTSSTTTTEDSFAKRFLSNYYNRVDRALKRFESTNSWTYSTNVLRQANASPSNQVEVFVGFAEERLTVTAQCPWSNTTVGAYAWVSIGEGSTNTTSSNCTYGLVHEPVANHQVTLLSRLVVVPSAGWHPYLWLESTSGDVTGTFHGQQAIAAQAGLEGDWKA